MKEVFYQHIGRMIIVANKIKKKDLSKNCNFIDNDINNNCWECEYSQSEMGCMYYKIAMNMFEELGFRRIRHDDDYIIYSKDIEGKNMCKQITFSAQHESVYSEFDTTGEAAQINMKLLKAINRQVKELRWCL